MPTYIEGADRNNPDEARSHMYLDNAQLGLLPMCGYGWNRSDGNAFSILRGNGSARGTCKICEKNIAAGKQPVMDGFPHKTKWI